MAGAPDAPAAGGMFGDTFAKLRQAVSVWNNALAGGQVGVAQTRPMARIAANPRIEPDVLTEGVWNLMADAMDVPDHEFERRLGCSDPRAR